MREEKPIWLAEGEKEMYATERESMDNFVGERRKLDFVWEDMEMLVKWGEIENKGGS